MSNAAIECTAARAMSQPCHYQVEIPRPTSMSTPRRCTLVEKLRGRDSVSNPLSARERLRMHTRCREATVSRHAS